MDKPDEIIGYVEDNKFESEVQIKCDEEWIPQEERGFLETFLATRRTMKMRREQRKTQKKSEEYEQQQKEAQLQKEAQPFNLTAIELSIGKMSLRSGDILAVTLPENQHLMHADLHEMHKAISQLIPEGAKVGIFQNGIQVTIVEPMCHMCDERRPARDDYLCDECRSGSPS